MQRLVAVLAAAGLVGNAAGEAPRPRSGRRGAPGRGEPQRLCLTPPDARVGRRRAVAAQGTCGADYVQEGAGAVTDAACHAQTAGYHYNNANAGSTCVGAVCDLTVGADMWACCEETKCTNNAVTAKDHTCALGSHLVDAASTTIPGTDPATTCCEANTCTAPGTAPTGYTIATGSATTVDGLGTAGCAAGYQGTPVVECATDGGAFDFRGCVAGATGGGGGSLPDCSESHGSTPNANACQCGTAQCAPDDLCDAS
eukprot:COSAG04_NODE_5058_length_1761_cov_6.385078_1_plen_255_part_10